MINKKKMNPTNWERPNKDDSKTNGQMENRGMMASNHLVEEK